jgi:hypothetical protein
MTNLVSAVLSEADRLQCLQLIADLKTKLPFCSSSRPMSAAPNAASAKVG